ncbi:MAG TPA: peroxide stress protein YaaA [Marmoricola sp.]|nr:peroxide stress protein YaaA [Marmoricola sp.]
MLILLPPSEGKTEPRRGKPLHLADLSFPELTDARAEVLGALVDLCSGDEATAMAVLGLGSTQADDVRRDADLTTARTARADRVYSGVLYDALDLASLDPAARRRATRWLAVTSALFGLVRPHDPIPAYRLAGDVSLPGVGKVAAHWRGVLDPVVREAAGSGLVVDLRSSTYAAFWRPPADLGPRLATVRVLHEQDGVRKVVSHFNKATKGRLVRSLLEHGTDVRTPAQLASTLDRLGWQVEPGEPSGRGTPLDVVVSSL